MSKIIKDATTVGLTGGTDETYVEVQDNAYNGVTLRNSAATDAVLAETLRITSRPGSVSASGTATKAKRTSIYSIPIEDAVTGEVRYASARLEVSIDIRDLSANMDELRARAAQLSTGSQWDNFFNLGSTE